MIILGYNSGSPHDGSVAIIKDGKIIFSIASERLTGKKHQSGIDKKIINYALRKTNLDSSEIDYVAIAGDGHNMKIDSLLEAEDGIYHLTDFNRPNEYFSWKGETFLIPHHICHTAAAYYTSGFDTAICYSLDTSDFDYHILGPKLNNMICKYQNHEIKDAYIPGHMYGVDYARVCQHIGLIPCLSKAGTMMGLSSFGTPEMLIPKEEMVSDNPDDYPKIDDDFTAAIKYAYSSQKHLENNVIDYLIQLKEENPDQENLCLSGGTFLNCNLNGKIVEKNIFKNVHHFPACGDDGLAVGAALYAYHTVLGQPLVKHEDSQLVYLGGSNFLVDEIPFEKTIDALIDGKIVAWANGRSEFGPRALGNRSILADPRNSWSRDKINQMIKNREWFRPFAPICLEEHYQEYFDFPKPSPYMLYTAKVKKPGDIPACVHVDGTARFQTVNKEQNPDMHKLISMFYERTGVPILLNTSLNNRGKPICEISDHVFWFLQDSELDCANIFGQWYDKRVDTWITDTRQSH